MVKNKDLWHMVTLLVNLLRLGCFSQRYLLACFFFWDGNGSLFLWHVICGLRVPWWRNFEGFALNKPCHDEHIFGWFLDRELMFSFVCRCVAASGIWMATASPVCVASSGRRTYVRWMVPWKHESCRVEALWITCKVLGPVSEIWAVHDGCPSDHISPTPRGVLWTGYFSCFSAASWVFARQGWNAQT